MIECLATGLVYRNPKPHLRAQHAWHPSLVALGNGEWLASFDLGQAPESLDYRTYVARSRDDGQTWSSPTPLFEDPSPRRATHSVRLSRVVAGMVVGFGGRFFRDDPEEGVINRANLGYVPMDLLFLKSHDGGRSWEGPRRIEPPLDGPSFETCHAIVELRDGRWLLPTSTWKGWNGAAPNGMKAIALVSSDQGQTWPSYLEVMDDYARGIVCWEQSLIQLTDGRLLAVLWAFDEKRGCTNPSPYTLSHDGKTFAAPRLTGFRGQTAKLLALEENRVLCLYRRDDKPGLWANHAQIDGNAWISLAEAPLWQGAASGMSGQSSAGEELSGLQFGFPILGRLANDDVLALFWCKEEGINNIRWLRLRVGN